MSTCGIDDLPELLTRAEARRRGLRVPEGLKPAGTIRMLPAQRRRIPVWWKADLRAKRGSP